MPQRPFLLPGSSTLTCAACEKGWRQLLRHVVDVPNSDRGGRSVQQQGVFKTGQDLSSPPNLLCSEGGQHEQQSNLQQHNSGETSVNPQQHHFSG
jgi:hypothetical protein